MLAFVAWLGAASLLLWALVLGRLARSRARQYQLPAPREPAPGPPGPLISVLLPARNEARHIEACLRSLLAQDHREIELLVLDDASEDDTLERAERCARSDPRIRVLRGAGPAPGWCGKTHALAQLAAEARGELLFFTDADVRHAPGSLSRGLAYLREHRLRALSCTGQSVRASFWEQVFEPLWPSLLLSWLPAQRARAASRGAFAIGQWILIERGAYEAVGGFAALRDEIVEDCALFAALKRQGLACRTLLVTPLFEVRMYQSSAEIWQGWSKNAYPALRLFGHPPLLATLASLLVVMLTSVLPFGVALGYALGIPAGLAWLPAVGPALAALGASLLLRARSRAPLGYFWTLPLAGLLAMGILANSAYRSLAGAPVAWKGRDYPGGRPPAPARSEAVKR